ncbi:MAG: hypothetical protein NTW21_14930 [Verrucomicrobia bacterium]|nr:hypothetical protein [Verrucomicrobiota bacterium]
MRLLIPFLISLSTLAAPAQSLEKLRQSFDERCDQATALRNEQIGKLNASYLAALERLLEKTKTAGRLETALPIHREIEAIKAAPANLPPLVDSAAGELKSMRAKYLDNRQQVLKTHATTLGGLADKMEASLKAREVELTKVGQINDAVAVRELRTQLEQEPDLLAARDLLKLGGVGGKPRAALQLRRYGDNLEVLVFYDRLGKVSMDSPIENVREKSGDGKELGDTKAKVLGEFVGAKGYTVDPYLAYHQVFDGKEVGGLIFYDIDVTFKFEVDKANGVRLAFKPKAVNPLGHCGAILPPNSAKGTYRVACRYFVPRTNKVLSGLQFVHGQGGPIGGRKLEVAGKWVLEEVVAESSNDTRNLLLYLCLAEGRKLIEAGREYVVLGDLEVEHLKFTAFVEKRFGPTGAPEGELVDPKLQPVFVTNGELVQKP